MSLVIPVECAQSVQMHSYAPEATPSPPVPAMQVVIVVVASVQVPVGPHSSPVRSSEALVHSKAVSVASDLAVMVCPEPPRALVVMVAPVQVPIRAHPAPMALVIAVQRAQAVEMHANPTIAAPGPAMPSVQAVIVVIPSVQMPVAAHVVPPTSIPTLEDALSVEVPPNASVAAP